jgi:ATP-dependent RNA helicase RhlE
MNTIDTQEKQTFDNLGIAKELMDVLVKHNFTTPTPIQHKAIPVAITGKDVIGIAQTGTGKSLAFGIPMLQRVMQGEAGGRGLILLPTRELAAQINETLQKIGREFGLRTAVLIGGASMGLQVKSIRNNPHIIIGTPGRVIDHLTQKTLRFNDIKVLALDEADAMLDMGFAPQIQQILQTMPQERQTMLFSATMPDTILKIANQHMKLPLSIEIAPQGTVAEKVEHELFYVKKEQRMLLLQKLLTEYKGSILIFLRTKHNAKKLCSSIKGLNFSVAEIHSNRSLMQRKEALDGFKSGKYRILVATDIAARGIDVKGIQLVLNYDLPEHSEDYVHRIGRTARAGMTGKAVSFVMPDQKGKIRQIERLINSSITISQVPGITTVPQAFVHSPRPSRFNRPFKKPFRKNFAKRY